MNRIRHLRELKKKFLKVSSLKWMNLSNSLSIETQKLVHFRHPSIDANDVGNLLDSIVATRIDNSNGIWGRTERDDRMAHTHDVENMSETTAYRNHIKNSEKETDDVFERETLNETIENIVTRLDKTQLDNNQMN